MHDASPQRHLDFLLRAERDLSIDEQHELAELAAQGWTEIADMLAERAHAAYAVAPPAQFLLCVAAHLRGDDRDDLRSADTYECPTCQTLLKCRPT